MSIFAKMDLEELKAAESQISKRMIANVNNQAEYNRCGELLAEVKNYKRPLQRALDINFAHTKRRIGAILQMRWDEQDAENPMDEEISQAEQNKA